MLEIRQNCECCDKKLPPDSQDAMICTFECIFCNSFKWCMPKLRWKFCKQTN